MPRLLIVTYYFPPHGAVGAKRALRMARHLPAFGWDVEVLTTGENYVVETDPTLLDSDHPFQVRRTPSLEPKQWIRRLRDLTMGTTSFRVSGASASSASHSSRLKERLSRVWDSMFSIPDERCGWIPFGLLASVALSPPDLILATLPPFSAAVLGRMLAWRYRAAFALDYRDPWSTRNEAHRLPRWRRELDRRLELRCLERASLALASTEAIRAQLLRLGARRAVLVPNAFDAELAAGVEPTPYRRFTILYAGTFYRGRTAEPVLRAVARLRDSGLLPREGISLRVIGMSGGEASALAQRVGVSDVLEAEGFLPFREAMSRMKGANVLLLLVGARHAGQIPAKLFDYMAARRFVLALAPPDSEAARLISELGIGRAVAPDDVEGVATLLLERLRVAEPAVTLPPIALRYEARDTMRELDRHLRAVLSSA